MDVNSMDAAYKLANNLLMNGNITEGLNIINALANNGHIDSQRGLGIAYVEGTYGLPVDYKRALSWFTNASDQNDLHSINYVGFLYQNGGHGIVNDLELAKKYYKKAADQGLAEAQINYAQLLLYDSINDPDHQITKKYFSMAANQGYKNAQYMMGILKMFEKNNENTYKESIDYFRKAKTSQNEANINVFIHLLSNAKPKTQNEIYELSDLLHKLEREHRPGYYYRGQADYYTVLQPSMFRSGSSRLPIKFTGDERLRKSGTEFYFEDLKAPKLNFKIRRLLSMEINNALGYPLTQAMFQQAGYNSEGLDITSDYLIALFFSTYEYIQGKSCFEMKDNKKGKPYSVIYRWRHLEAVDPLKALNSNFIDCKNFIPTYDIFKWFGTCDTVSEFITSLKQYAEAISWGPYFDIDDWKNGRPYHLIKLPKSLLNKSRVIRQKGSLLLCDNIIPENQYYIYLKNGFQAPHLNNLDMRLSQDLSEPGFCDTFYYHRNDDLAKKTLEEHELYGPDIYNEEYDENGNEDISHLMLYDWVESKYMDYHKYGTSVITNSPVPNYGISYEQMLYTLQQWQKMKSKCGYFISPD